MSDSDAPREVTSCPRDQWLREVQPWELSWWREHPPPTDWSPADESREVWKLLGFALDHFRGQPS